MPRRKAKPTGKQKPVKPCGPSHGSQLLAEWQDNMQQQDAAALLDVDAVSYSRFVNGKRKPSAKAMFVIERLTDGRVYAKSWYEPPIADAKSVARKAG